MQLADRNRCLIYRGTMIDVPHSHIAACRSHIGLLACNSSLLLTTRESLKRVRAAFRSCVIYVHCVPLTLARSRQKLVGLHALLKPTASITMAKTASELAILQCNLISVKMHDGQRQCQLHYEMPQNDFKLMGLAYVTMPATAAQVTAMNTKESLASLLLPIPASLHEC